jgi:hypothetical protein
MAGSTAVIAWADDSLGESMEAQKLRFLPVNVRDKPQMAVVNELVWEYFQWGNAIAVGRYGFVLTSMTLPFHYRLLFGTAALLRLLTAKPSVDGLLTRIRSVLERHS